MLLRRLFSAIEAENNGTSAPPQQCTPLVESISQSMKYPVKKGHRIYKNFPLEHHLCFRGGVQTEQQTSATMTAEMFGPIV